MKDPMKNPMQNNSSPNENLDGMKVAVIATDGVEQPEIVEPMNALKQAGAKVTVLSPGGRKIQAFRHHDRGDTIPVDGKLEDANPDEFDGLLIPGGALNADALRIHKKAQEFARAISDSGKPIAVICHGPWLLVSAGLVRGRTLTSYMTIQDDMKNAGGNWVDQEVMVDKNWVSSRKPDDIPAFNREMLRVFASLKKKPFVGEAAA